MQQIIYFEKNAYICDRSNAIRVRESVCAPLVQEWLFSREVSEPWRMQAGDSQTVGENQEKGWRGGLSASVLDSKKPTDAISSGVTRSSSMRLCSSWGGGNKEGEMQEEWNAQGGIRGVRESDGPQVMNAKI